MTVERCSNIYEKSTPRSASAEGIAFAEQGRAPLLAQPALSPQLEHLEARRTPPPRAPRLGDYARAAVVIPLIYLCTAVMGTLSLAVSFFDPRGERQNWCAQVWSRLLARLAGARVRVHGAESLEPGGSYVFLSTHQSYMDIPVKLGYLPTQLRIAAKRELFRIPFLGWHLQRAGHIAINRSATADAVATLQRAAQEIRPGISVFIYPEGTRSRDGSLQPFKKGGFKFALQAGLPIVPLTIIGSRQVLPRDSIIFRPGPIDLHIGAPLPTAGLTEQDLPFLMAQVRAEMLSHFPVTSKP